MKSSVSKRIGIEVQRDRVLLLHGIARGAGSMRRLERAINLAGYETLNLDYPSCKMGLAELVEQIHAQRDWITAGDGRTHIVAYSMGCLLARAYITRYRPPKLGNVVMLAPPNSGSEIADLLAENIIYRFMFGPAGAELTTHPPPDIVRLFGPIDYPLGIIAGCRCLDPFGWWLISGPNDGRVSIERTKVLGMTDHVTIKAAHFTMPWSRIAIEQTLYFLKHKCFKSPVK
ncbi:esterase/lipase family protein [Beijerinckia indica]|uniref:AB hydrolase-1 domain-containing protein n=1 Tax=Beijerinckia indica subsp. indica (strain ATCC 9039 / DSM 1715 / NCIMB 8712) TaxID=395963 RepID=B2IHA8_BEII9|nr:alpha/beta fold hydrolase [Beijerinckia indica]ACB95893.1 conserved hypothetical protein [Beijerinckia indica subsp. indica ATCC 9039]